MDELESIEDVVNAELLEEYLGCRACGCAQELQWLSLHPELAEEFCALGRICDQLAALQITQACYQDEQIQEELYDQTTLPILTNFTGKTDIIDPVYGLSEKPVSLN